MAIGWNTSQKSRFKAALGQYDIDSALCARAANKILPVAREHDPEAVGHRCLPNFGRFVCAKRKWYFHVNVYVANHYVDALSGPDGLEKLEYLASHWPDSEAIHWDILSDTDLERLAK